MKPFSLIYLLLFNCIFVYSQTTMTYNETFTNGQSYCPGSRQYDNWVSFKTALDTNTYSFLQLFVSGTYSTTGKTCTDRWVVSKIASNLKNNIAGSYTCNGLTWNVGTGCANNCGTGSLASHLTELTISGSVCNCTTTWSLRPTIMNANWGGINTTSCNAATQTMNVQFSTSLVPLPVHVFNFKTQANNKSIELSWESNNEDQATYFEILKSSNGTVWESIGKMKGKNVDQNGNAYQFSDEHPNFLNYYKIRAVDIDNNSNYSQIERVNFEKTISSNVLYIYPNPSNGRVTFNVANNSQYNLIDANGRIIMNGVANGETVLQNLTPGVYALTVYHQDAVETTQIVVK